MHAYADVQCPSCHAKPGVNCRVYAKGSSIKRPRGSPNGRAHRVRERLSQLEAQRKTLRKREATNISELVALLQALLTVGDHVDESALVAWDRDVTDLAPTHDTPVRIMKCANAYPRLAHASITRPSSEIVHVIYWLVSTKETEPEDKLGVRWIRGHALSPGRNALNLEQSIGFNSALKDPDP